MLIPPQFGFEVKTLPRHWHVVCVIYAGLTLPHTLDLIGNPFDRCESHTLQKQNISHSEQRNFPFWRYRSHLWYWDKREYAQPLCALSMEYQDITQFAHNALVQSQ